MKRFIAFLLLAALITASACGDETVKDGSETTADTTSESSVETESEYEYADLDLQGEDFTVLNSYTTWGFYTYMDFEEQTGESLDDKVYNRNRFVEDKYNFNLNVVEYEIDTVSDKYRASVLAGDNEYDVAYIRCDRIASLISDGYLYNLLDYPTFRLDEDWRDQTVVQRSLVGDKKSLYFASNDFSLCGFDGTLCCFFNEDMMADLQLELPYDLVRNGTWTIDKLSEYAKAGANLNGDDSFTWNENGNAVYGIASYEDSMNGFLTGSGISYITVNNDGQPELLSNADKFYSVVDKAYNLISTEGSFIFINSSGNNHYEMLFKNERALFTIAEIKASSKYRDMDATFGIVPIPKYDEAQEEYYSHRTHVCLTMTMPKTNNRPEATGSIMDTLSYLSTRDILPEYYNVKVAQKGLRNEDSIEMLDIIAKNRSFDIGEGYNWTESLSGAVNAAVVKSKQNTVASLIDTYRSSVEASIEQTLEYMKND